MHNASAFAEALGVEHAPTVVWLSMIPWKADERDLFIKSMTGKGASSASTATKPA